jgi:acetate kinase
MLQTAFTKSSSVKFSAVNFSIAKPAFSACALSLAISLPLKKTNNHSPKNNNIMKILVLNCGSSSIKYKLFDMTTKEVLAQGGIEKIGLVGSFLKLTLPNGEKKILEKDIPEHTAGIEFILNTLVSPEYGAIKSLDEINAVGHRMVHGGERFSESVLLNKEVLDAFIACNDLAPLHNPANLKGVNAVSAILPNVPQVGVFDTAFHQTMPDYAYMYAIPYELYEKYGVRRYGFHGTSHRYVSQRVCEFLGVDPKGF